LTSISGVSTEDVWNGRVPGILSGIAVSFISKKDLIENKRSTGRTKDLADVEVLTRR